MILTNKQMYNFLKKIYNFLHVIFDLSGKLKNKKNMGTVKDYTAYYVHKPYQYKLKIGECYDTSSICRPILPCGFKQWVEEIAEQTRIKINNNLPSRHHCLFVCDREHVRYWYNYFEKRNRNIRLIIYEVKLSGKLFWTYADYLRPERYWEPNNLEPPLEREGLFDGRYCIVRQCDYTEFPDI